MLVLLPPSETKATGGNGPALDLDALSFPDLNPLRRGLVDTLVDLAADVPASLDALGLSERQRGEVGRNAELWTAPTTPALRRYTGVLYDALDLTHAGTAQLARAQERLAVASALFGLVRARDPIPAYRLSAGTTLPGMGTLRAQWRPALAPVLEAISTAGELVVDLRSGAYAALARVPGAVTVRVVTEDDRGHRKTVSHHNKAYKGRLAATLATGHADPSTVDGLMTVATHAGMPLERAGERELVLVTDH